MPAGYSAMLISAQGDGAALTNSTTLTSILPPQAKLTLPANFLDVIGKKLRIFASGRISNVVTTPGTLTLQFRMGPTSNIIVATSQAIPLNIVAKTNVTWILEWFLTLRAVGGGTTANLMHTGYFLSESVVSAAVGAAVAADIPASAPAVGTGFDSTVANVIDLQAQFSVLTATTSIQLHQFELWSEN
jgi:hypothetical protein